MNRPILIGLVISMSCLNLLAIFSLPKPKQEQQYSSITIPVDVPIQKPATPVIIKPIPGYQDYDLTIKQLEFWKTQAKDLVETGTYGTSTRGKDLHYIRVTNLLDNREKPKVLITACIHGNEPWSASTTMAYIGNLLANYGKDSEVTELLDTRDIYFIPVVSPDSYPSRREVDGVDPNRDFPSEHNHKESVKPVGHLREFFLKHKFKAVISAHTWGEVFLVPWGDRMTKCPNHEDYVRIVGQMAQMSGYRWIRACELYKANGGMNNIPIRYGEKNWSWGDVHNVPIHGSELDWYYRNGALAMSQNGKNLTRGSFAVVMEMGTHQRIPSQQDVESEFSRTFKAVQHFIKEAPLVEIWWDSNGNPVNKDGSAK